MEESLLRIENRVKKGGHNINTDTVMNRFGKRFEDLLHSIVLAVSFAALVVLVLTSKKYKPES